MTDSSLLNLSYHSAGKFATGPPSRAINMRTRITQPSGAATPRNSDVHNHIAVPKALEIGESDGSVSPTADRNTLNGSYHWSIPVSLDDVESVSIGETVIPIS